MKPAAIYARVSTADQVKGTSLDGQVELCQEYAKANDYTVISVMQEDASGARIDRPKLGELRDMAARREIEALIVFDPDRLSRSMAHTMMLMEEFEGQGAGVLFVNAPREDTPEGEMLFGMRALFAQYERTKIMERTRRGKDARVRAGQIVAPHRIALGYKHNKATRGLEIDDDRADVVRSVFRWYLEDGLSMNAIACRLTETGIPTAWNAAHWRAGRVRDILKNEVYTGRYIWNQYHHPKGRAKQRRPEAEWITFEVPAIVPRSDWLEAQRRIRTNADLSPRNKKRGYLLAGLVFCGICGRRLQSRTMTHKQYDADYSYYLCRRRGFVPRTLIAAAEAAGDLASIDWCSLPFLRAEAVDDAVWSEVTRQIDNPDLIGRRLEAMSDDDQAVQSGRADLDRLAIADAHISRETERLVDVYQAGALDRALFVERMAAIRRRKEDIEAARSAGERQVRDLEAARASATNILLRIAHVRIGIATASLEDKRRLLLDWSVRVTVTVDQGGRASLSIHGLPLPAPCVPFELPERRPANQYTKKRLAAVA